MTLAYRKAFLLLAFLVVPVLVAQDTALEGNIDAIEKSLKASAEDTKEDERLKVSIGERETYEEALYDSVMKYLNHILNEEHMDTYQMMWQNYRDVVSVSSYLRQKRVKVVKGELNSLVAQGDTCAQAKGFLIGHHSGGGLGDLRIPFSVIFVKGADKWEVFRDPYKGAMGFKLPKAKTIESPCKFE